MKKTIVDSSAILALLKQEAGYATVEKYLPEIIISAVNLAEIVTVLLRFDMPINDIDDMLGNIVTEVIDFDQNQALLAAEIGHNNRSLGLSFGDRACLSLAKSLKLPVLTADKIWDKVKDNITVIVIR